MGSESGNSEEHRWDPHDSIESLFNYNPPVVTTETSWVARTEVLSPFSFYDKHLDPKLSLLRIKSMPSIVEILSNTTDTYMKDIKAKGIDLPLMGFDSTFFPETKRIRTPTTLTDAVSVARFYLNTTADYCAPVASTLALHPHAPDWMTAITWSQDGERGTPAWTSEGYALRPISLSEKFTAPPDLLECLDTAMINKLQYLIDKLPDLGTWEFAVVSDESEALLRGMNKFTPSKPFCTEICGTVSRGITVGAVATTPPDSISGAFNTIVSTFHSIDSDAAPPTAHLRRSARISSAAKVAKPSTARELSKKGKIYGDTHRPVTSMGGKPGKFVIPAPRDDYDTLTVERLLQHVSKIKFHNFSLLTNRLNKAWTRSVKRDTTFIVFQCGNFERIGVRHRQSQTLYLSDVVDVVNGKGPAYGKLHTGLFIAAFEDGFDRAQQLREAEAISIASASDTPMTSKRPADNTNHVERRTRRRITVAEARDQSAKASAEALQVRFFFD